MSYAGQGGPELTARAKNLPPAATFTCTPRLRRSMSGSL